MCFVVSVLVASAIIVATPGLINLQEQPFSHLWHRYRTMPVLQISGFWPACQELEEIRGGHLLRSAQPEIGYRCFFGGAQERIP
jgi:hypothetical protein